MSRNRRNQRPTPPRAIPLITTAEARDLGTELVRELAQHAGDPDAVLATLLAWLDIEGASRLSLICMSVVQTTYADYLTRVPVDQIPAGSLTLPTPERNTA